MNHYLIIITTCFLVGISFFIMATGFIKNKWIVYAGALLFVGTAAFFMIGFKDVLFT